MVDFGWLTGTQIGVVESSTVKCAPPIEADYLMDIATGNQNVVCVGTRR